MDDNFQFELNIHSDDMHVRALPGLGLDSFKKIFCTCGRIVDIDADTYRRRTSLRKTVECSRCRNLRIASEIDMLDEHYNIVEPEPGF